MTEATLPIEERGTQKRYTEISRFNLYLPPMGKVILPGPEVWRVDETLNGLYLVLLRIEASDDKEGDTNLTAVGAGGGVVHGGAVAGFSLPTLRYYVRNGGYQPIATGVGVLTQVAPAERAVLPSDKPVDFWWTLTNDATTYRLEVEDLQGNQIVSAILATDANKPDNTSTYLAPSWLKDKVGGAVARWRVLAFDQAGHQIAQTEWRSFRLRQ